MCAPQDHIGMADSPHRALKSVRVRIAFGEKLVAEIKAKTSSLRQALGRESAAKPGAWRAFHFPLIAGMVQPGDSAVRSNPR